MNWYIGPTAKHIDITIFKPVRNKVMGDFVFVLFSQGILKGVRRIREPLSVSFTFGPVFKKLTNKPFAKTRDLFGNLQDQQPITSWTKKINLKPRFLLELFRPVSWKLINNLKPCLLGKSFAPVSKNFMTYLTTFQTSFQKPPYGSCGSKELELFPDHEYTTSHCLRQCDVISLTSACGCTEPYMGGRSSQRNGSLV